MKSLVFSLFLFSFSSISAQKMKILTQKSQLQAYINKEVTLEGIMQMEKFENKVDIGMDYYEFWLLLADSSKVLLTNKTGKPLSKEPVTKKVQIRGTLSYGKLNGKSEKAQSLKGYQLDFTELKIIK